jgi:hypothetical protein
MAIVAKLSAKRVAGALSNVTAASGKTTTTTAAIVLHAIY